MSKVKTIKLEENIFAANNEIAANTRKELRDRKIFFLNLMSAPGSGKTTFLIRLIKLLKNKYKIAVMDVDIETSLDASKIANATGIKALQINNNGLCHIDASMTATAIRELDEDPDILILENIGNLVCPAEFDVDSHKSVMLTSVPEGDDKPLKYPLMFSVCDAIIINKTDTTEYFSYDFEAAKERILSLNPNAEFFCVSAKTGEGISEVAAWLERCVIAIL